MAAGVYVCVCVYLGVYVYVCWYILKLSISVHDKVTFSLLVN